MFRAVIFDFDGLILDTEVPDFESWQEIYRRHGSELPFALWAECIGTASDAFDPFSHLESLLGRKLSREEVRSDRRSLYYQMVERQQVLPGVTSLLDQAVEMDLKIGLATSSSGGWAPGHLKRLGLDHYFHAVRCAEDVQMVKPDPELYRCCMEYLGVSPEEGVAFEDSPNGVRAARSAGLKCVAVPNALTRQLPLEEADLVLPSLEGVRLSELFARLAGYTRTDQRVSVK